MQNVYRVAVRGIVMVQRRGRKGTRRGRAYARRAGGYVRRGGNKVLSAFGFTKSGFKASNAIITGGVLYSLVAPATALPEASPLGIMMGRGAYATQKMEQRAMNAAAALAWNTLGVNYMGTTGNASTKGIGGLAVGSGILLKMGAKVINPLLAGSPVKL